MGRARMVGRPVRPGDAQTLSDLGPVALYVRARAHRDGRRGACTSAASAAIPGGRYVGDDLPGWASGVVLKHEGWPRSEAGDRWTMVGLLYGSVLIYLSIFATGGGHGTPVPFILSSAPLSVVV